MLKSYFIQINQFYFLKVISKAQIVQTSNIFNCDNILFEIISVHKLSFLQTPDFKSPILMRGGKYFLVDVKETSRIIDAWNNLLIKILIDIGVINIAVDCPSYYFVHLFVHTDTVGHVPQFKFLKFA